MTWLGFVFALGGAFCAGLACDALGKRRYFAAGANFALALYWILRGAFYGQ